MIRKNSPPKIPSDRDAHLDEKSHCRLALARFPFFVIIEVSSQEKKEYGINEMPMATTQ